MQPADLRKPSEGTKLSPQTAPQRGEQRREIKNTRVKQLPGGKTTFPALPAAYHQVLPRFRTILTALEAVEQKYAQIHSSGIRFSLTQEVTGLFILLNIVTVCIPQYHAYVNKFYTSEVQMASKKEAKKHLLNYPSLKSKTSRKERAM